MTQRIYGDIPNIKSDLEKKYGKYKPYTYYMYDDRSILLENHLFLNDASDIEINYLPNTIEYLYFKNYKIKTPIIKWPTNLVAISLEYDYDSDGWMSIINQLPPTLKFIKIYIKDDKISTCTINWPPNLEVLYLHGCDVSNESISTLPVSLKLLEIDIFYLDETKKYNTYFDNLPSQLEILKIDLRTHTNAKYFTSINNLSNSIQYLSLRYFDYNVLKFPNSLKYLELYNKNKFNDSIIENIKKNKKPDEIAVDIVNY